MTNETITYPEPLTAFIYLLMSELVPAGKIAELIDMITFEEGRIACKNEHILKYAQELADQIQSAKSVGLKKDLEIAFDADTVEAKKVEKAKKSNDLMEKLSKNNGNLEEFTNEELSDLESLVKDFGKADENTSYNGEPFNFVSIEEAKGIIEGLKTDGNMTDEEVERIKGELDEVKFAQPGVKGEVKIEEVLVSLEEQPVAEAPVELIEEERVDRDKKLMDEYISED